MASKGGKNQKTTKDPEVEGSRSYQSLVTPRVRTTKAPKTLVFTVFQCNSRGTDDP